MTARPSAIVTGAGAGIGRASAELFAERGYDVVAVDLSGAALSELEASHGVVPLVGDVAEESTNVVAVELALDRFGRLDAAVLNAGIGATPPLEAPGAVERFDRMVAVNLRGPVLGIRAAAPVLRAGGGGAIVLTASISGLGGDPGVWAYNATKAGVVNLVRGTSIDYAAQGIRINAVAPGLTDTPRTAVHREDPELAAELTRRIPMRRWARPREQAEAIWFLASPAASYITGVTLPVDGGLTANTGLLLPPGGPVRA
ncbi:SDR family NAD(P)-dependent oxidoreductase [Planotetraspora sp. GP83]|uniref:SDR family NAD(P)-dependent oxidoreductase n=1 Tax=Planotetraspora sp. GP83 TaxID=3156264 RepID=UPI0035176D93